jgi:hypothetical protein
LLTSPSGPSAPARSPPRSRLRYAREECAADAQSGPWLSDAHSYYGRTRPSHAHSRECCSPPPRIMQMYMGSPGCCLTKPAGRAHYWPSRSAPSLRANDAVVLQNHCHSCANARAPLLFYV